MITYLKKELYTWGRDKSQQKQLVEIACLSTDTKPTEGIENGSLCLVIDTGEIHAFNGANSTWVKIA